MAMLGFGDYLCEACKQFDTDGIDGFHPNCYYQRYSEYQKAVRIDEICPYKFEPGVPSCYPVNKTENKRRANEILKKLGIEVIND